MSKYKYFIPAILWMIFIFLMSSQTGTDSSVTSGLFTQLFQEILKLPIQYIDTLSFIVRKMAHITEYFVLTILFYYAFTKSNLQKPLWFIGLLSILYACSDEFHQLFIPGRGGCIQDVGIDSIGVFIALFLIFIYQRKKTSSEYQ